jgi:hypothetical protein
MCVEERDKEVKDGKIKEVKVREREDFKAVS